jgi:hypothetical protein
MNHATHRARAESDKQKHRLFCDDFLILRAFMTSSAEVLYVIMCFHRGDCRRKRALISLLDGRALQEEVLVKC